LSVLIYLFRLLIERRSFIFREMYWSIIKSVNSLTFYRNKSMFQFSLFCITIKFLSVLIYLFRLLIERRSFIFQEMYWSIIKSVNSLTFYRNKSTFQFSLFCIIKFLSKSKQLYVKFSRRGNLIIALIMKSEQLSWIFIQRNQNNYRESILIALISMRRKNYL
jgi:hypothetical protein